MGGMLVIGGFTDFRIGRYDTWAVSEGSTRRVDQAAGTRLVESRKLNYIPSLRLLEGAAQGITRRNRLRNRGQIEVPKG